MNQSPSRPLPPRPIPSRPARLSTTILWWVLWVGAISLVLLGSFLPGDTWLMKFADRVVLSDKIRHWTGYAVVTVFPMLHENRKLRTRIAIGVFLAGVLIEIVQGLTGRDFEFTDILWNGCGVGTGVALGVAARRWTKR